MEFEFAENFYDTIKSRARVAALRKNTNVLEVDENKKKRKTIRRNNLKNKAKNGLKGKAKVRRRKASKDTEQHSPVKRRANSNKKTPSPSKKKLVPATNNEIDDEEAALILCNLSTISQRSFDSFYTRFPSTADNKIEIPILNTVESFNHVVAYSDQPYSHILLDHNYWSSTNQPEIKFELKVESSNLNHVAVVEESIDDVPSCDDDRLAEPEKSIENEVKVEIKQEVDTIVNKVDVNGEKEHQQQQQQPEVNNNLLAESLLSIVKHEVKEEAETTAAVATVTATAAKALTTTTKVKQKKVVKKKEKCRKNLNTTSSNSKKKTQNKTIKKRKEKKVSLSNGFASQTAKKLRTKSREKVDVDVKECESPRLDELQQQQNHDKTSAINTADIELGIKQNGSAEELNGDVKTNGHAVDDIVITHQPQQQNLSKIFDDQLDDDDDDVNDEKSWTLICDFHGTILDKLTSNNVRFCGDMLSESRSTATMSSSSSSSSTTSSGLRIVGSMNNYQTSSDSRYYDSNDYYTSHRSDSSRYDPVTNCEYRRSSYANSRSLDPRTNNYAYNNFDNRHRKEHFHRHYSYSEGIINNQQTYASYKAQKTFEQRQMPHMMDSGNPVKQSVSVFELPVNGASSIVKDLLPIIERKELLRSKSVADPRLASSISDSDKFQNPKKKVIIIRLP